MTKALTAPIFDIQRFSIHDGPGIRTLVFFKGCLLRCKWCQNPESQDANPIVAFYKKNCHNNFDCMDICPEGAILPEGFKIDYSKCSGCGECISACAYGALRMIGRYMTSTEVFTNILSDLEYYKKSGGGVTFSGGEPTLYPEFLDEVIGLCKNNNIHTLVETCGTFLFSRIETILKKVDMIYFDLKIIDSSLHKAATASGNSAILKNARLLVEYNFPVHFRMPLVSGYTDSDENIADIIKFLSELKQHEISLLKYHNMGEAKIDIIQGTQNKLKLPLYSKKQYESVKSIFESAGINVVEG